MTANPPPDPRREAMARIIDPKAWDFADRHSTGPHAAVMRPEIAHETRASLAKADAILRLQPLQVEGWEPIETAPKDGTRLAGWIVHTGSDLNPDPFQRFSVIWWDDGCTNPGWERKAGWHADWIGEPSHWRPLPAPPQTPADGSLEAAPKVGDAG